MTSCLWKTDHSASCQANLELASEPEKLTVRSARTQAVTAGGFSECSGGCVAQRGGGTSVMSRGTPGRSSHVTVRHAGGLLLLDADVSFLAFQDVDCQAAAAASGPEAQPLPLRADSAAGRARCCLVRESLCFFL